MATYNKVKGNYTIQTLNGGNISLNTSSVLATGNVSAAGNITGVNVTGGFIFGDGRFLTNVNVANVAVTATTIANGTSNVNIPVTSGNITFAVNGTGNVVVVSTVGANITTGTASTSNVTGALKVTGGAGVAGNIYADAVFSNNSAVLTANSTIDGGTY
jgi:hypothetical protein